jgi:hypothetical protein
MLSPESGLSMSGSLLGLYLLLLVVLIFRLSSGNGRKPSETLQAASVEEAISKIKELYPNAVCGRWQTDRTAWLFERELMWIWENQEALDRNSPPVAEIISYVP